MQPQVSNRNMKISNYLLLFMPFTVNVLNNVWYLDRPCSGTTTSQENQVLNLLMLNKQLQINTQMEKQPEYGKCTSVGHRQEHKSTKSS